MTSFIVAALFENLAGVATGKRMQNRIVDCLVEKLHVPRDANKMSK
jgi:hypothetical protein